jgi:hypothetical protein
MIYRRQSCLDIIRLELYQIDFLFTVCAYLSIGQACNRYTVLHIFRQVLFWAGNQDNHQKIKNPCYPMKIFLGMQQFFFFFLKIKIKNGLLKKKREFQLPQSSKFFCENNIDWSLG